MHTPPRPAPDAPATVAPDLVVAARAFFPEATAIEPVAGRDGLARVAIPAAAWRVRRWPAAAAEMRIAFVHAALARARDAGLHVAPAVADLPQPAGGTILTLGGHRYDAQSWLPGQPAGESLAGREPVGNAVDFPAVLPEGVVVALAETIARLHAATEDLARSRDVPTAPLRAVAGAVQRAWAAQRTRLRPVAPKTPLVQRWLAAGERALPAALAGLERAAPPEPARDVVLHLGLWPAHILLEREVDARVPDGPRLVGLIGWEGVAVGSPLLDLAHLVTRCSGWSAPNAELALAAYAGARLLSPEERRLLPAVAALDLVATAGHLLDLAYGPRREIDDQPRPSGLRAGADAAVASLEAAAAVAALGDEPRKPAARRWQRRPAAPPVPGRHAEPDRSPSRAPARPSRADRSVPPRRRDGGRTGGPADPAPPRRRREKDGQ